MEKGFFEKFKQQFKDKPVITSLKIIGFIFLAIFIILACHTSCMKQIASLFKKIAELFHGELHDSNFLGDFIGSGLAVIGAVHIQRKIDKKSDLDKKREYLCIVFFDLKFARSDILRIFSIDENKPLPVKLNDISKEFLTNKKLYFSPNWISDVARLNNVLNDKEIEALYDVYGILNDINRNFESGNKEEAEKCINNYLKYFKSFDLKDKSPTLENLKAFLKAKVDLDIEEKKLHKKI